MLSMELLLEKFLKTLHFLEACILEHEKHHYFIAPIHVTKNIYVYMCVYNVQKKNNFSFI